MTTDAFMRSDIPQWSDWSTPKPIVSSQQQHIADKTSERKIRSNKISPTDDNSSNSKSRDEQK
jgi:hypothetical protein